MQEKEGRREGKGEEGVRVGDLSEGANIFL